jgi:hypothetical protein
MRPIPESPFALAPRADPPEPYQPSGQHLQLPASLPETVSAALAWAVEAELEAGVLLYGVRAQQAGDSDVVRALAIPEQIGCHAHYRMPHAAIAAASSATRPYGWVTVGQVHSHPGEDVEHSWYDDRHAISIKAMSFVLPNYGRDPDDWLARIGIHEYSNDWWHRLTVEQAAARVSFADAPLELLDLRT